eukprot:symbB.v1.2.035262.t1/scaffold4704.1/size36139/4
MCFVCTSFGAFLCSYSWCGRNIELLVVILWTLVFEAFCLLVLVQTHVIHHVFFTAVGSAVVSLMSTESIETSPAHRNTKWWLFGMVILGTAWVVGIFRPILHTQHWSIVFLQRQLEAIRLLLSMSPDDVAVVGESGEPVADISVENLVSSSLIKRSKLSGSGSSGTPPKDPKGKTSMAQSPAAGSWIEGLETFNKVGQGSFGQVFRGKWQGKDVAVKAGAPEHEIWIIQEWCNGGTLARFAASKPYTKPEGEELIGRILRDVGSALNYLHDMDVVHGDLSSSNVMLTYPGTADSPLTATSASADCSFVCKVCDFGLARVLEEGITTLLTSQIGTISHMPPELIKVDEKRLTKKADIYSMGVLLYELVLGDIPYRGLSLPQVVLRVARDAKLELPPASDKLTKIFRVCTEIDAVQRPCVEEVLHMLCE